MYHIGISYDFGNKKLLVVIDGKVIYNDNHDFRFMCQHNMQIGYNSFSNSKVMVKLFLVSDWKNYLCANFIKCFVGGWNYRENNFVYSCEG
jgi:hypothetical protein